MLANFFIGQLTVMANSSLSNADIKHLKGIGHQLNPVVMIGGQGVTPTVIEEIGRALSDHELIKVKIPAGSKADRDAIANAIAEATDAILVTSIGRMVLLLRRNLDANPKLSNLARFG